MKVFTTVNPDCISNIYLITDDDQKYGVIIDPGSFALNVYKLVQSVGIEIKKIIITHNDIEQTAGIPVLKRIYNAEIFAYTDNIMGFKATNVMNGSIITEGNLKFKIIETPVHTYDSISILIEDTLFVGDILQAGTLSSLEKEKQEPSEIEFHIIQRHVLSLPDYVIIYPGIGPASTVEIERKFNPYFNKSCNCLDNKNHNNTFFEVSKNEFSNK